MILIIDLLRDNNKILYNFTMKLEYSKEEKEWIPVSSTDKVSNNWIRDLKFNPLLQKKSNGVLIWW